MPPSLPHISGTEAVRALEKLGFAVTRQKGSHRGSHGCVVPLHRELKRHPVGCLKQAGITADELMQAL